MKEANADNKRQKMREKHNANKITLQEERKINKIKKKERKKREKERLPRPTELLIQFLLRAKGELHG